MAIVVHLAMTAAEFDANASPSGPIAWMACHFSPYGTGLSNLPPQLPEGSILILNDRTPVFGHSPERIASQMAEAMEGTSYSGILLDLQRASDAQSSAIVKAITALPYPVAVTPGYAKDLDCAVFLPPPPLNCPLKTHLAPWQGREIWLEAALEQQRIRVDKNGSHTSPWEDALPCPHTDETLHCLYRMEVQECHIDFFLRRDKDQLWALLEEADALGIRRFVGLHQQLGDSFGR